VRASQPYFLWICLWILIPACGRSKPLPAPVELASLGDSVATDYSDITEAASVGADRWAVLAPQNESAAIVDFPKRTVTPLGGRGSKQLRNPASLFFAADTLYIGDWGLRRTTLWSRSARLLRTIPTADVVRGKLPRSRDSAGNFYVDLYPSPGADGSGNRDSAAVVRLDPNFTRGDTIARLAPLDIAEVVGDAGRRFERRVFGGMDRWGVLGDGSLWVARVYNNRVDWRAPSGRWTKGEALPDRVLEVTRYDRELFLRKFPPELRGTAQQLPFAPLKPPFEAGMTSAAGDVWLEKSRAPADSVRRYHVVNRRGHLLREVQLRGNGRIIAVGPNAALVVEPTPAGFRLIQFGLPALRVP
jgi:hypothetical protein